MWSRTMLPLLLAAPHCIATTIFVSSYAGTVTTLSLSASGGNYSLEQVAVNHDCAPNPSWLTLDTHGYLYCLNEGLQTINGSLSSYRISRNGSLTHIQNTTTINGPVSGAIYGAPAGPRAIALAHYVGSAVSSWILGNGNFTLNQNIVFSLDQPGPDAERQDAPHEHEVLLDPTGQYLLVPDLGADLIRVLSYDNTLRLKELEPIRAEAGDGPRHAAFWNPDGIACETCTTFLYVANELASTVTGYAITYVPNGGGLQGEKVYSGSTYGYLATPAGNAPSEIQVSPDNRFLLIGNRNDSSILVKNPDPANNTNIASDTISTFALDPDGSLRFTQLAPAFGSFPRQFVTNAIGNLVGIGLQESSEVVILARDVVTGLIGDVLASIKIDGQITSVVFDDISFGSVRA